MKVQQCNGENASRNGENENQTTQTLPLHRQINLCSKNCPCLSSLKREEKGTNQTSGCSIDTCM